MSGLRDKKKRETRQRLSDVATDLFYARGFDAVTVEEIAAAANVSKVTVFNYFARKEDLHFDRQDEVEQLLRDALTRRPKGQSPLEALRLLARRLHEEKHPFARVDDQTVEWWRVVIASPSLTARLREFGDEVVEELAILLAGPKPDGVTRLFAGLFVQTWRSAYAEALRLFEQGSSAKKANAAFLALVEQGLAALRGLAGGD
jgi:AcrR family transcriptional regulator